eukprot:358500-Pelagomonas_calceolata.AAC.1
MDTLDGLRGNGIAARGKKWVALNHPAPPPPGLSPFPKGMDWGPRVGPQWVVKVGWQAADPKFANIKES